MRATIEPLVGKYYGTKIFLEHPEDADPETCLKVWMMGDYRTPSQRQLDEWGMTLEQAREDDMLADGHWESAICYEIAQTICDALNARYNDATD